MSTTKRSGANGDGEKVVGRMAVMTHLHDLGLSVRGAGRQYGGRRDVYAVAGYVAEGAERFEHYQALYERNEIAGRIVDAPAKTTWRTPPEIIEEGSAKGTAFMQAFTELAKRLDLWAKFERTDRLAGIGRYAVLVLGTRGGGDTALRTPLQPLRGLADLLYVAPYEERRAKISTWVTNPSNPRFGLPELYQVDFGGDRQGFTKAGAQVHASRIIHVAEDAVYDEVYGRPRLKRALNRLMDLDKIAASVGEAYWQSSARILQATVANEAEVTEEKQEELDAAMLEMVHDLRRQFTGKGVKLEWLPADVNPPKEIADFYFALIAVATGIPRRILFGSEQGDVASTTDQATYFGMINERQEHFAEPMLVRAFIDQMIALRVLPAPATGKYEVQWPTLFEETETDKAEANLKRAQAAAALTPMGGDPMAIVEVDENRDVWLVEKKADTGEVPAPEPLPAE